MTNDCGWTNLTCVFTDYDSLYKGIRKDHCEFFCLIGRSGAAAIADKPASSGRDKGERGKGKGHKDKDRHALVAHGQGPPLLQASKEAEVAEEVSDIPF